MSKVIYTGPSDFQEFGAADFQKANVDDQKKVIFAKGEPTEVSEAAAEALTNKEGIFGDYSFDSADEEATGESSPDETTGEGQNPTPESLPTSGEGATTEGTASPPAAGNVGRGSTGRGTSTR